MPPLNAHLAGPGRGSFAGADADGALEEQGFNTSDREDNEYEMTPDVADGIFTASVSCNGDGEAVYSSDTGTVTSPDE